MTNSHDVTVTSEKIDDHRGSVDSGVTISTIEILPEKNVEYFEKALEHLKFGRFNVFIILISGMVLANVLLETLGISFVLPVSQCELHWTIEEKGILSAVGFIGIIISSHLWGFLADTMGRRKVIRPTLILGFVFSVLSSFSNSFGVLVTFRLLNGICISGGSATIYAYLGEFHTLRNRDRAIMCAAIIFGVGSIMLPAIAWLIINREWMFYIPLIDVTYKPWRLFMVVCAVPGLICGLALFKLPESPKFLVSSGREEETLEILKNIYATNTGNDRESFPVSQVLKDIDIAMLPKTAIDKSNPVASLLKTMWDQTSPLFSREYIRITLLVCLIQFIIFSTSNGMYMWFPDILNSVMKFETTNQGQKAYICDIYKKALDEIYSNSTVNECVTKLEIQTYTYSLLLELTYILGFAIFSLIINTVPKIYIIWFTLCACGAGGIATVSTNIPMLAIYFYLALLSCGLAINVLGSSTIALYPTRLRAMAVCISLMMGRLGSVVGANYIGALLRENCEVSFYACGATLIVAGFLAFLVPKPITGNIEAPKRISLVSVVSMNSMVGRN